MANQLFVNPHPYGVNTTGKWQNFQGSIVLAGNYVTGGEPLNWQAMATGTGYSNVNIAGQGFNTGAGLYGNGSALVTAFAASGGTVTATALNRFTVGQKINFVGNTTALGLLLNGTTVQIVTASPTQFTFLSSATGSGTGETGMAIGGTTTNYVYSLALSSSNMTFPVTSLAVSGGICTVTATTEFLPGARVTFKSLTTALGVQLNAAVNGFVVLQNTGTTFTFATTLTGAAGADAGFSLGVNAPQPFGFIEFSSQKASGYVYAYDSTLGNLHVQIGGAAVSSPGVDIAAGAYPAGVLNDVIVWDASFAKDR